MAFRPIKIATLFGSFLIIACHSTLPVQVAIPPEISLDTPMGHILVINRLDPNKIGFENENKTEIYELALGTFLEGLQEGFQSNLNFSLTVAPIETFISENPREEAGPLPPEEIANILKSHQADFLLSLDKLDMGFTRTTEKDDEGNKTMHSDLIMYVTTTFYDKNGQIVQRVWDQNDMYYESRDVESGLLAVGPSLGKADEAAKKLAFDLGYEYKQKFYPTSETQQRTFYSDREFGDLSDAVNSRQWDRAEQLLLPWVENEDDKLAGHAAYDLGVIKEVQGEKEAANEWYQMARKLLGSKFPGQ